MLGEEFLGAVFFRLVVMVMSHRLILRRFCMEIGQILIRELSNGSGDSFFASITEVFSVVGSLGCECGNGGLYIID